MNLSELRTFLVIIETGSLARAADQLHVTQSTVTTRLKSLENQLGQTLIVRAKSGASLTAAGVRLHRYAQTISELWSQARQVTSLPDALSTTCNLACHPDLWPGLGQRFFDHIRQSNPGVALSVWHGSAQDIEAWLDAGLSDLALTHRARATQRRTVDPLPSDTLIAVGTSPDRSVLSDPSYVYVEAGEIFGREHAVAFPDVDTARLSFGQAHLGLAHILTHGGSAYLPERVATPYLADGRLHRLDAPTFERPAFLVANTAALAAWPWFDAARTVLR